MALLPAGCSNDPPPVTILLISIDTCRADALGVYGRKLADGSSPTPVIDALAREGVVFGNAYTPAPLTLPAHTTMFSGLYPNRHGVRENDSFKVPERKNRAFTLLAEDLKAAGFATAAFVSAQPMERRFGLAAGFDVWDEPDRSTARGGGQRFRERPAAETAAKAIAHLRTSEPARRFVFVHFFDPHAPYEPAIPLAAAPPGDVGAYLAEVAAVDRAIGEILAAMPDGGRDAWVIVTSDHGEGLGEHGEPTHGLLLYETTLRVPLVVRPARGFKDELTTSRPARLVDIAPTIGEIAGIKSAAGSDGSSLIRRRGATEDAQPFTDRAESLYAWYQFRYARLRAARSDSRKLVEGGGRDELYDLARDPDEAADLAANDRAEVSRLKGLLREALLRSPAGEAASSFDVPDVSGPYIGGRPPGTALEPTEDENAKLPHVLDRWNVVTDLETARAHLRRGEPGKAVLTLNAHAAELTTNPALLFWTARARQELAESEGLPAAARLAELDAAAKLYRDVRSRFQDPRGLDSELLVLRSRHRASGDPADLRRAVELATGEIAATGGTALTWALRGVAKRDLGDAAGAEADLVEALRRDPENPRIAGDLARLKAKEGPK